MSRTMKKKINKDLFVDSSFPVCVWEKYGNPTKKESMKESKREAACDILAAIVSRVGSVHTTTAIQWLAIHVHTYTTHQSIQYILRRERVILNFALNSMQNIEKLSISISTNSIFFLSDFLSVSISLAHILCLYHIDWFVIWNKTNYEFGVRFNYEIVGPLENLNAVCEQCRSLESKKKTRRSSRKKIIVAATKSIVSTITHSNLFFTHFSATCLPFNFLSTTFVFETTALAAVAEVHSDNNVNERVHWEEANRIKMYTWYIWKLGARVKDMKKKNV